MEIARRQQKGLWGAPSSSATSSVGTHPYLTAMPLTLPNGRCPTLRPGPSLHHLPSNPHARFWATPSLSHGWVLSLWPNLPSISVEAGAETPGDLCPHWKVWPKAAILVLAHQLTGVSHNRPPLLPLGRGGEKWLQLLWVWCTRGFFDFFFFKLSEWCCSLSLVSQCTSWQQHVLLSCWAVRDSLGPKRFHTKSPSGRGGGCYGSFNPQFIHLSKKIQLLLLSQNCQKAGYYFTMCNAPFSCSKLPQKSGN